MRLEIGSEFSWNPIDKEGTGLAFPRPGSLVFSGRTAIEIVLKNIPNAKSALLPSYCCESIIVPFKKAGIEVIFYDVHFDDEIKIKIDKKADILFWCNYFGFVNDIPEFDGIIIEDITHSLLSYKQCHKKSDYLVASIRKWEPIICGGYCSVEYLGLPPSNQFVEQKKKAMMEKTSYLSSGDIELKTSYLSRYRDTNIWLANNYSELSIDSWSREYISHINMFHQRERRCANARVLYENLDNTLFMFSEKDMDCPLFVPVFLRDRDKVQALLSDNNVYCPIHWPRPVGCISNIYDYELSLVCDQRYSERDMLKMVSILKTMI